MKELQEKYANVILNVCLKVKKNQSLFISANSERLDFVRIVADEALKIGVKDIYFDITDPILKHSILKELNLVVESVTSGNDCITKVMNNEYDLIFLDHMMPVKDGVETLKELHDKKSNIPPTIALTANSYSGIKEYYLNEGFADYLAKPVGRGDLIKLLNRYL